MKTALFSTGESLLRAGAVDETLYLIASGEVGVSVVVNNTNHEVLTLSWRFLLRVVGLNEFVGPVHREI
jgi:CRP-like cAMP-binding protein